MKSRRNTGICAAHHSSLQAPKDPCRDRAAEPLPVTTPGHVKVCRKYVASARGKAAVPAGSSLGTSSSGPSETSLSPLSSTRYSAGLPSIWWGPGWKSAEPASQAPRVPCWPGDPRQSPTPSDPFLWPPTDVNSKEHSRGTLKVHFVLLQTSLILTHPWGGGQAL